jgi:biopolymer transport protein TolQ
VAASLSLISLFANASITVQLVMGALLAASVLSWALIWQRGKDLWVAEKALAEFEEQFSPGVDVAAFYSKLAVREQTRCSAVEQIFVAGFREFVRLSKNLQPGEEAAHIVTTGVERATRVAYGRALDQLEQHLPLLATIQSMSPFIGLFGTVWGIMHAFRELGMVQQASIAMVAPGIAEALIATAMGLVAAIPAGIAYNRYAHSIDRLANRYQHFIDEFINLLYRKLMVRHDVA